MASNQDENLMLEDDVFQEEDLSSQTAIAQTKTAKIGIASIAEKAAQNAAERNVMKRKTSTGSSNRNAKTAKFQDQEAIAENSERLDLVEKILGTVKEDIGIVKRTNEGLDRNQRKYTLKIEGIPSTVVDNFAFLEEFYQNGLKMKTAIKKEDFRDLRLVTVKNKKMLLMEFVTFPMKTNTLQHCKNLKDYKYDGKFKLSVRDDKTPKDRKREFVAMLVKKLFEAASKVYPDVLKDPEEKIKVIRTDWLVSKHRPAARYNDWLEELHKAVDGRSFTGNAKKETDSITKKIDEVHRELSRM